MGEFSVLLVEDEVIVAADIEMTLLDAGLRVDAHAVRGAEAVILFDAVHPDLCLVDLHLLDGEVGLECGRRFAAAGAMVVFMTANKNALPTDLAGAFAVIDKPYSEYGLLAAFRYLHERLAGHVMPIGAPESLCLAPLESRLTGVQALGAAWAHRAIY